MTVFSVVVLALLTFGGIGAGYGVARVLRWLALSREEGASEPEALPHPYREAEGTPETDLDRRVETLERRVAALERKPKPCSGSEKHLFSSAYDCKGVIYCSYCGETRKIEA